jgi:hypothetical protein
MLARRTGWAGRPIEFFRPTVDSRGVPYLSRAELLFAILALIGVELNHLKWIWWTQWKCRDCGTANEHCACGRSKWVMYL